MTEKQLKEKIAILRKTEEEEISHKVEKAIRSGAIDLKAYEDNFLLAKIVLNAVYSDLGNLLYINVYDYQEEVDNLKKFL